MKKTPSKLDLNGVGYCASFNFRRTARAVTKLFDLALQGAGVRSTQFTILVGIAKNQPVAVGSLADVIMVDSTTLTRSLKLLQKEGLIKISGRAAKRQRFLQLTAKGQRTLEVSLPIWKKVQARFVSIVGPRYWKDLRDDLERLAHVATKLESFN
jgi:DNA-binding MarR family transcriptional regulator